MQIGGRVAEFIGETFGVSVDPVDIDVAQQHVTNPVPHDIERQAITLLSEFAFAPETLRRTGLAIFLNTSANGAADETGNTVQSRAARRDRRRRAGGPDLQAFGIDAFELGGILIQWKWNKFAVRHPEIEIIRIRLIEIFKALCVRYLWHLPISSSLYQKC